MRILTIIVLGLIYIQSSAQTQQEIDWIKKNSVEISTDPENITDFVFLDSLVANKRIVMLGENTHGTAQYFILKNRIIRYLHENLGFNILSWESSLLDCYAVESQKAMLSPKQMAMGSLHFVYRTEQVLPIMDYVKNSDLVLTGFDAQPTVYSVATAQFLGHLDCLGESFKLEVKETDSVAQTVYKMSRKTRKTYIAKYEDVLNNISRTSCDTETKDILSRGIEDRINFMINTNKGRDERMANNLMWLLSEKYPDEKFIIYAHNAHNDPLNQENKYANFKTMAEFLPDSILSQTYNIAIFGYSGTARNNVKGNYQFKTHPELSLENYLYQSGFNITFLDIKNQKQNSANSFLYKKVNTMYWGNVDNPKVLDDHYDGVILVNQVSPSTKLKK